MRINTGHDGVAVEQEDEKQEDAADEEAEGVFYVAAQFFNTEFPQRRIKGKGNGSCQRYEQADIAAADDGHGIGDDDQADDTQDQGNGLLAGKGFVNDEIRKNHDKNRVTGKDDSCQAGIGHVDPDLEEDHAEADVNQPEDSQIAPIGTIEVDAALLQIADSQRHEQQPADEEPKESQLERRERRSGNLQGNFHRTKGYGCQNNT